MRDLDPKDQFPRFAVTVLNPATDLLRDCRLPEVSARRWSSVAFTLAVAAGVLAITFSIWPIAFLRGWGTIAVAWGVVGHFAGALYLGAAYLARRRRPIASPILSIAGLVLITSGLGSGRLLALSSLDFWWLAIAFDLLPIVLGVFASGAMSAGVNPHVHVPASIVVELPPGAERR